MDPEGPMIICLFDGQAHMLAKASSYEVDMSFKRVKDKDMKEVVFASYYPDIGRSKSTSFPYPSDI
jgi:phosphomevalonate kinase